MGLKSSLLRKSLAVTFVLAAASVLPSNAATVPDLYTVTVVPDPAARDQRAAAIQAAMAQLLVRVTGSRNAPLDPAAQRLLAAPDEFLSSYGLDRQGRARRRFPARPGRARSGRSRPAGVGARAAADAAVGRRRRRRRRARAARRERDDRARGGDDAADDGAARDGARGDRGGGGRAWPADRVAAARSRGFERRHLHRRLGRIRGSHRRGVGALSRGRRADRPRAARASRQRGRVVVRPRRRAPGAAGRCACATASTSRPIVTRPSSARSAARASTLADGARRLDAGRLRPRHELSRAAKRAGKRRRRVVRQRHV